MSCHLTLGCSPGEASWCTSAGTNGHPAAQHPRLPQPRPIRSFNRRGRTRATSLTSHQPCPSKRGNPIWITNERAGTASGTLPSPACAIAREETGLLYGAASVEAKSMTMGEVLGQRFPLVVPRYQRTYAWDEAVGDFVQDISAMLEYPAGLTSHFFGGSSASSSRITRRSAPRAMSSLTASSASRP